MKVTKVTVLKKGLPEIQGQEIKSVSFDVTSTLTESKPIADILLLELEAWIQNELNLKIDLAKVPNCSKSLFAKSEEDLQGYIAFENYQHGDSTAFELHVVSKFYKGLETSRVRSIQKGNSISVQVSTFIDSRNPVTSIQEIPRIADSLITGLASSNGLQLAVDGSPIRNKVLALNAANISDSPMNLYNTPGLMPLVGFLNSPRSIETTDKLGDELFGLAHVLLLSDELFESLKNKEYSESKFFVYWRDGSPDFTWFDITSQMYRFKRQIFTRSLREDSFSSRWRSLLTRLSFVEVAKPQPSTRQTTSATQNSEELQIELAIAKSEATAAAMRVKSVEREMNELVAQFDETAKNWQKKIAEAAEISARLHGQLKSGKISARDFIVQVDLSGETPTQNALDQLSIITNQAIVFTEHAATSWPQARKSGYKKPAVMEKALEALAKFALDFRLKEGQFGMSFEDYAAANYDLVWVPADQALPTKKFRFEGRDWNQEKHVKADITAISQGPNELGRIHFDLDIENFRVIVNHIGGKQYKNKK